jgi:hypothetical protein
MARSRLRRISTRLEAIAWLVRRLRRRAPADPSWHDSWQFDSWQFGRDVRNVMSARIARAMAGDLSAAEARRMVLEKQSAAIRAQHAYARALLNGDLASAHRDVWDIYQRAVRANRKRLRRGR